jgi:glycosyltransferase involved in cell wall biosynthesis
MIRNESILCMPLTTWDSEFPNTLVQLMQELSKENKILFVDYEYTFKDLLHGINGGGLVPIKRVLGINARLRKLKTKYDSEIYVLTPPPVLPFNWIKWENPYRWFLQINSSIIRRTIQDALFTLNMESPILINGYNPFFGLHLTQSFNESLNIYFCYDEIKGDSFYSLHGPSVEQDYIRKSDGVIVTSEALYESKNNLHHNCFVVKNGVDFNLFNKVVKSGSKKNERPIIGYTGSIDERFDIELVRYLIQHMPEADFQFVGRIPNEKVFDELNRYSNVSFLGSKKPDEVPDFLKYMDVCIIPYLKTETTKGVYPLKINEYLAAGKPVVMTDFATIRDLSCVVDVANNHSQFLQSIKKNLVSTEEQINLRTKVSSKNSWEKKAEELSEAIESIRAKKLSLKQ